MLTIPLELEVDAEDAGQALPFVRLEVNGTAVRALLDSGAARTAVPATADAATRPASTTGSSAFGVPYRDQLWTATIAVAGTTIGDFEIADAPAGSRSNVGQDVLSRFRCRYQLVDQRLTLDQSGAAVGPEDDQPIDLGPAQHVYLRTAWGSGVTADAVFDTGASVTVIDVAFADRHPELLRARRAETGTDASGSSRDTPMVELDGPTVLGHTFAPSAAAIVDLAGANATIPRPMDLILGWPLISQVDWIIDHPRARACVIPRR